MIEIVHKRHLYKLEIDVGHLCHIVEGPRMQLEVAIVANLGVTQLRGTKCQ